MLKNYITIALRNIRNQKGYSFINIAGLTIGMTSAILILLFVQYELSFDKYHENSDRIYRVSRQWLDNDGASALHLGHVAPPFAPLLKNDFEGIVEEAVRFTSGGNPLMEAGETRIVENEFFFADPEIFNVFSWEFVTGDPNTALVEPASIILTESAAQKYFGDKDPINSELTFVNRGFRVPLKVTGIVKDIPSNSHFTWSVLCSFSTYENAMGGREALMRNFGSNNFSTYLLFPDAQSVDELRAGIPDFMDRHLGNMNNPGSRKPSDVNKLHFLPLTDIHLKSQLDSEIGVNGNIEMVYIFLSIAVLILIIACINFMNLSTARSNKRSREVGMRKVLGAEKKLLVRQFISESMVFAILSFVLAILLVATFLPYFNDFTNKPLTLNVLNNPFVVTLSIGIVLFVGFVAGSYPAFYLSSFQPAVILKGGNKTVNKKFNLRSALVIFQFCISAGLIISVGIVQDQLKYVQNKDLGFNKEQVMVLPSSPDIYGQFETIKQRLERNPGIQQVSLASRVPSGRLLDSQNASAEVDGEMINLTFRIADVHVDHGYLEQLGVKLLAGRYFNPDLASDSTESFILNEAAIKAIGWESAEAAIDKPFNYGRRSGGRIIGVTEDFHFESLHQSISPIVFMVTSGRANSVLVRVSPGSEQEVEELLREEWSFLRAGFPFTFSYISDSYDALYSEEERLSTVISFFSLLAVIIAALGLFGLASFITEQRVKEIGIRKVMGASIPKILILLTRGFTLLVLIGFLISIPVSYYFMNSWLGGFAYATEINIMSFVLAGIGTVLIAWLTVAFRTIKAARANPVESLRYE